MPDIAQLLQQASLQLQTGLHTADRENARRDAELLLCHALGCNTAHLMAWPEKIPDSTQQQHFRQLIRRRASGEPIAYIKGTKEFWSRDFAVDRRCLIPRPETECLIEFVLQRFGTQPSLQLADLGTGSGAIAVTLACERPGWHITATDIDPQTLILAQHNAERHRADNIRFVQSNWFDALTQQFDVIVSNPPYVASGDSHLQQGDLRFEPVTALIAGADGMDAIRQLCRRAGQHLNPAGWLVFEHGYDQKSAAKACLEANGFRHIQQLHDDAGWPRLSAAQRD